MMSESDSLFTVPLYGTDMPTNPDQSRISSSQMAPHSSELADLESVDDLNSNDSFMNSEYNSEVNSYHVPMLTEDVANKEKKTLQVIHRTTSSETTESKINKDYDHTKHPVFSIVGKLEASSDSKPAIEIELSPKMMSIDGRSLRSRQSENFDFISLQLSSEDDIDHRTRFETFFGIDYAVSSCAESVGDSDYGCDVSFVEDPPFKSIRYGATTTNQSEKSSLRGEADSASLTPPDAPPPYSEVEHPLSPFKRGDARKNTNVSKRALSLKIKKSNNQLRDGPNDVYRLDKYLPPYRSLLNPNRVYDYRTNTFIDSANKRIVTMYNKSNKTNRIVSLVIKAATDISQRADLNNNNISNDLPQIEYKTKPEAKFQDLPDTIVNRIINFLGQRELVNMLYVSNKIKEMVIPILYYYPKFTSTYRVAQFVHTILNNNDLAKLVKVLDLSKIELPITLTPAEKVKYQDKLIYGIDSAIEVLSGTNKTVYAGWRDWKFRNNTKYGIPKRARSRSNSLSTLNSTALSYNSTEIDVFTNNYFPELSRFKTTSHTYDKPKSKLYEGKRSMSTSNLKLEDEGFLKSMRRIFEPWKKKTTRSKSITIPARKKVKQSSNSIHQQKPATCVTKRHRNTVTFAIEERKRETIPFSTPHPVMRSSLGQYCFKRDIPVGFVIHLFEECINLEEINFDGAILSSDYKLCDYSSFNWKYSTGIISRVPKKCEGRAIFWSDTDRDIDVEQDLVEKGIIEIMEVHKIWEPLLKLKNVHTLSLRKINSIEQSLISKLLFESEFAESITKLRCHGSGMVKRSEWDILETACEWKSYLLSV